MLKSVFRIISFYDTIRWHSVANYNLINYYKENLDNDSRLLTHWLCYITDRQMAFERVWDIGGYIFSELIDTIKKQKNLNLLNPTNSKAFIAKNHEGYYFTSQSKSNGNEILKQYGLKDSDVVIFSSRYYPSDYYSILYTLSFLEKYDFSLTKFIAECYRKHENKADYITRILYSLYLVTYHDIGQPTKSSLADFDENLNSAEIHTEFVLGVLNSSEKFEKEYKIFDKAKKFGQKRAWCSLRDFFKSPEFNENFKGALKDQGFQNEDLTQLFSLKSLQQFELPGDVWNNNSKFRNCILKDTEYQNTPKALNKILREYYNKNKDDLINCYPEQFDVTFDFVPRMCMKNNCDICPIGSLKRNSQSNFTKTCVQNPKLYCSVAMIDGNYKIDCYGSGCKLLEIVMPFNNSEY